MSNDFLEDDLAILAEFVDESESDLDRVAGQFLELEERPRDFTLINEIFRPFHSLKGNSAFLGLMQVRRLAHEMETLMDDLRRQRSATNKEIISILLTGTDEIKAMLARIRNREPEVTDTAAFDEMVAAVCRLQADSGKPAPEKAPAPPPAAPPPAPAPGKGPIGRTIRIPEKTLDLFAAFAGELESLRQKSSGVSDPGAWQAEAAAALGRIAAAMRDQIAALRSVTAGELLQRAPRIARETAAVADKQVAVTLAGEDLRVPKSLVEILETPLMHLVRNAVDHGIEMPLARRRAGKPEQGQLTIEAREEGDEFVLVIADDGAGIDFKTLLAKAMLLGLCPRGRSMTPADVINLIFLPGVSAAKQVTDISGRGVGMDVVKSQIEAGGGRIQVNTKSGKGTEFIIRLPRDPPDAPPAV